MASGVISCRWDWCRSSFPSIDALDIHVKHEHVWPMKPMRKTEIALMRRMDLQSLHSSPNTDSSVISRGISSPVVAPSTSTPLTHRRPEDEEEFDTFAQLSSPPQTHPIKRLPASPALEGLIRHDRHSGLSAAVEVFDRTHGHKANQRPHTPPHQRSSPMHHLLSQSSSSSQEVVEQQLTQEDDAGSPPILPSEPSVENEFSGIELRWPTDDEADVLPVDEMRNPEHKEIYRLGSSLQSVRGQNFRCGSLNVPLDANISASAPSNPQVPHVSQGSQSISQPFAPQTQASYSSQAMGWSQT